MSDWKERLVVEHYQLQSRITKLEEYIKNNTDIDPLLLVQLQSMKLYKYILELRASNEGINLKEPLEIDVND